MFQMCIEISQTILHHWYSNTHPITILGKLSEITFPGQAEWGIFLR